MWHFAWNRIRAERSAMLHPAAVAEVPSTQLVDTAKLRWRIERDHQELKQELGLGHYEGRGWRGFHHHASLCIAAYGFLVALRRRFPPQLQLAPRAAKQLPDGYRPRGSSRSDPSGMSRPRSRPSGDA